MSKSDLIVAAAEANRSFSKLLRIAREGGRVTITSHGEPVAELIPAGGQAVGETERERQAEAHRGLMEHLEGVTPVVVGPWTREELYDRD
ncbi:MAG TPA: type II toxin-antitoxin system prevent-host-death family antitoxin [Caulobacteraceae bacterium]|jgi:prevent-host-death family protein|nr:type II toxin-antitoxin system prevent-host-death family antitoxin [Caulobacteraceae bacterium]